uniref:Multidrug resistance-associated protein 1-like n=1 Tax=Phallusia mammillata TaxID=59560 RepID=A0A6F9D4R2_9ASCI|nr:multidrug resistance-associated protein 1-like [Phallusia mammillata]
MTLTEFCGGEVFFDAEKVWNSTDPTFSNCYQQLVFDLVPCVYLWIFTIPYYFITRNSEESYIPISPLFKAKVITTILLWVFAWTNLIRSLVEWGQSAANVPAVDLVVPLIVGMTMALAVVLLQYDRMKGVRSSGFLTCYWLLFLLTWAFVFKSKVSLIMSGKVLTGGQILRCVTFFLSYLAVIVNFAFCFFADKPPAFKKADLKAANLTIKTNITYIQAREDEIHMRLIPAKSEDEKPHETSPEEGATFLSKITFWWFTRMVILGYKQPLVDSNLWNLKKSDASGNIAQHFLKNWNAERAKNSKVLSAKPTTSNGSAKHDKTAEKELLIKHKKGGGKRKGSLLWAMCKTFGPYFLVGSLLKICQDCLSFVGPQILSGLISFTTNDEPAWRGYFLAVSLFVVAMTQSTILQQYFHICFVVGMRLRSAIISAVYRKALVMSNSARKESTLGEIVNLMSVDAQRFMDLMTYLNVVWSGPFQIIVALYFLWQELGPSVLAGLAIMILLIPINALIASKARALQVKQMGYKDERIKLMNEILNGIKVLKMYAWEMSFKDKITKIRSKELKQLRRAAYLNALSQFAVVWTPFLVSLTTFAVYVMIDDHNVLDAQKAFVSLSLFNILRFPLTMLPTVVSSIVQASVSLQRLEKFLNNDELDESNVDRKPTSSANMISIDNGTFKWDREQDDILKNISMSVPDGSLVAVVGQVGCGKSSLMSAMLGDMEKTEGRVSVQGSIAYVPQQAWIQNLTAQDNITFGKELDICRYQDVVEACELKADFDMLPAGDQTEIGERGINLSGGQKQRVAIARAVYQDAQIYLFDDPLSSVDSHVGKNIFDNVLGPGGCLKRKTRILVTHGLAFLPQVDKIYVLVDGQITEAGNYNELLEKDGAFAEFLRNYAQTEDDDEFNKRNGQPVIGYKEEKTKKNPMSDMPMQFDCCGGVTMAMDEESSNKYSAPKKKIIIPENKSCKSSSKKSTTCHKDDEKKKTDCCGGVTMATKEENCNKKKVQEDKCCSGKPTTCHKEDNKPKKNCCGGVAMATGEDNCSKKTPEDKCCKNSSEKKATTCHNEDTKTKNDCCGGVTIATEEKACNNKKVEDKCCTGKPTSCHGDTKKNPMSEAPKKTDCCGNAKEEKSCNKKKIPEDKCCNNSSGKPSTCHKEEKPVKKNPITEAPVQFDCCGGCTVPMDFSEEKDEKLSPAKKGDKLISAEKAATGSVKLSVFVSYMRSIGYFLSFLICLFFVLQYAAQIYSSIWLSDWSMDPLNPDGTQNGTQLRLGVYGILGLCQAFMVLSSSLSLTYGAVAAATVMQFDMLCRIVRAPMSFFDTTPLGRLMNRFSKDVYLVDEVIPRTLSSFLMTFFKTAGTFAVIIYSTPLFAVVIVPLLLLYYFIQRFYVRTSRQLKRLESISRSPIYSHFGESLAGATTIRAYGLQQNFIWENEVKIDTNQMSYYPIVVSNRWLGLRLELVGNCVILFAAIFAVSGKGMIDAGIVGLSISYAMQVTSCMSCMVREASTLETNIVAVERVKEYSNVSQEAPLVVAKESPPANWPAEGGIEFENYSTRYRPGLDLVVKNFTVDIKGGEKIGVAGRTGAGKTSLTMALFRIIESSDGCIRIDGINIAKMGLQDLRSKLSIIPQDPVLFSGSLRMNLDPFDAYSDEQLWSALEHSHLKNFVESLPSKLEHEVSEGGENLSVGQRQLVCLARALLRNSKILVLDEATAAVDFETDDLIQATIRVQFEQCTTFTIAHRLNTIMDSTRVIVLDAGRIAEFDSPQNLLKKKGIFYGMAKDAGLV